MHPASESSWVFPYKEVHMRGRRYYKRRDRAFDFGFGFGAALFGRQPDTVVEKTVIIKEKPVEETTTTTTTVTTTVKK